MQPTVSNPSLRTDLSEGMSRANNVDYAFVANNYLLNREPDYSVYLYNVSEQAFELSRPPILRKMMAPARKAGQRYTLVTSFPQPLLTPKANVDSNEYDVIASDSRRFVMDLVNPNNTGLDQDATLDPKTIFGLGNDLGKLGLFWSLSNPPKEEEVERCIKRMEKEYRRLIEEARAVEVSAPATLKDILTPSHHFAADYFGEEYNWHKKQVRKEERSSTCPVCGDPIRTNAAWHPIVDGGGALCIIDWSKAIRAGIRTKQQAADAGIEGYAQYASVPAVPAGSVIVPATEPTTPEAE